MDGGRSTFPYSMSGRVMSDGYRCRPVTTSRAFTLRVIRPATLQRLAGVNASSSRTTSVSFRPAVSSP